MLNISLCCILIDDHILKVFLVRPHEQDIWFAISPNVLFLYTKGASRFLSQKQLQIIGKFLKVLEGQRSLNIYFKHNTIKYGISTEAPH